MKFTYPIACALLACAPASSAQAGEAGFHEANRLFVPVAAACPAALAALPERLYPAWRALDSAAQVAVEFKLDGSTVRDIAVSGGHGDYAAHVRSAVRAMKCQAGAAGVVAVRFRVNFVYPEDRPSLAMAVQVADEAQRVATR